MSKRASLEYERGRYMAQKLVAAVACERCASVNQLQRHHKDRDPTNNDLSNIEVLCQRCHFEEHMSDGTWGIGLVEPVNCKVCGASFKPTYKGKGCTVCSPECHREWGRICVNKRWAAHRARKANEPSPSSVDTTRTDYSRGRA